MSQLYELLGTSRQAQQKQRDAAGRRHDSAEQALRLIRAQRQEHPRIGLRKLYEAHGHQLRLGRDAFIAVGVLNGLAIAPAVNRRRTTFGSGQRRYPNLLVGRKLNDVNQVWVSDLTYYPVGRRFSYLTLVMDLYSRMIVGHRVAPTMHACWTIEAFDRAFVGRSITPQHQLIAHSDQGTQYMSAAAESLMTSFGALMSTSEIVYENSHAERLNGILKQEYLDAWPIPTHASLEAAVAVAVERYNVSRPHSSLAQLSPLQFETRLKTLAIPDRPVMNIWPPQPLQRLSLDVTVPYKL
jgi:putative transposase